MVQTIQREFRSCCAKANSAHAKSIAGHDLPLGWKQMAGPRTTPERLGWFSDGVFAIAITIMIFQLKPPEESTFAASGLVARTATGYLRAVSRRLGANKRIR